MFKVELATPFENVPGDVLETLRRRLAEIGKTLGTLPADSHIWPSLEESGMLLELEGWRFQYTVDAKRRRLRVTAAAEPRK